MSRGRGTTVPSTPRSPGSPIALNGSSHENLPSLRFHRLFLKANLTYFIVHRIPIDDWIPLWLPAVSRFVAVTASYRLPASWSNLEKAKDRIDSVSTSLIHSLTTDVLIFFSQGKDIRPFYTYVLSALSTLRADCPWIVQKEATPTPASRFKIVLDSPPPTDTPTDTTPQSPLASTTAPHIFRLVDVSRKSSRNHRPFKRK